jgi:hypothetical protein
VRNLTAVERAAFLIRCDHVYVWLPFITVKERLVTFVCTAFSSLLLVSFPGRMELQSVQFYPRNFYIKVFISVLLYSVLSKVLRMFCTSVHCLLTSPFLCSHLCTHEFSLHSFMKLVYEFSVVTEAWAVDVQLHKIM